MKRWKKIALVSLALIILSQTPFIYRRFQLRRLSRAINDLNSQRVTGKAANAYADYRGVIHVHSMLGGHSTGNFIDIIRAANANSLSFVVMTEHPAKELDTAEMTLQGFHNGVLFIGGSEVVTSAKDRLLLMPGSEAANQSETHPTQEIITAEKQKNRLAFIAYPQDFHSWDVEGYDGIEVYNLYTNARKTRPVLAFFDGLWSYWSYPELMFTEFYERPNESLKKWDEMIAAKQGRLVAIAGSDAHQNVGASIGDASGKKLLQIQLDPYERSFRIVRTHALVEKEKALTAETLLAAIREGHCYIAFDLFSDATGFSFTADNGAEQKLMGDEISLREGGVRLNIATPLKSRIMLIKDGQIFNTSDQTTAQDYTINQKGVYRVEVYLPQLSTSLEDKPWIISNPIYVR